MSGCCDPPSTCSPASHLWARAAALVDRARHTVLEQAPDSCSPPPRFNPSPQNIVHFAPLHLLVIQAAAQMIKNQLDRKFGSTWHVVCGEGFAVSVLYQQRNMIHVYYGKTGVMAFKC